MADASRRTTKVNAYVSGFGGTRRVVLFDTLLRGGRPGGVQVVVAHELGHRRERHVAKLTLLAMAGAAVAVVVLWAVLGTRIADPQTLPEALLLLLALELAALPRGLVALAPLRARRRPLFARPDRDPAAFARAHAELARRNLSDLEPPRVVVPPAVQPPDAARAARARPRVARGACVSMGSSTIPVACAGAAFYASSSRVAGSRRWRRDGSHEGSRLRSRTSCSSSTRASTRRRGGSRAPSPERDLWDFTCECGAPDCRVRVSLTLAEYEALRAADGPVQAPGHEQAGPADSAGDGVASTPA